MNDHTKNVRHSRSQLQTVVPLSLASRTLIGGVLLLLVACNKAPEKVVESTLKQDAMTETVSSDSSLAKAASRGDIAKVKQLINDGAKIDATDALGRTPLHMAVFYSHPKTTALLIASGSNINAKDRTGMTPLHAAVLVGDLQEVDLLLEKKPEIDTTNEIGLTPLHLAAATGQPQLSALLIKRGADVQKKDNEGRTPLSYATNNQHQKTSALLQQYLAKQ